MLTWFHFTDEETEAQRWPRLLCSEGCQLEWWLCESCSNKQVLGVYSIWELQWSSVAQGYADCYLPSWWKLAAASSFIHSFSWLFWGRHVGALGKVQDPLDTCLASFFWGVNGMMLSRYVFLNHTCSRSKQHLTTGSSRPVHTNFFRDRYFDHHSQINWVMIRPNKVPGLT